MCVLCVSVHVCVMCVCMCVCRHGAIGSLVVLLSDV